MFSFLWQKRINYNTPENYIKILLIQSVYRMYREKTKYNNKIEKIKKIQNWWKKVLENRKKSIDFIQKKVINNFVDNILKEVLEEVKQEYENNTITLQIIEPKKKDIKVRNRKVYHQYLENNNDLVLNTMDYRKDYVNYLNSNFDYNYLEKYEKYDNNINCRSVIYNSIKTISFNMNLIKNCFMFEVEKNSDNLKRQKLGNKYIPKYGTYHNN